MSKVSTQFKENDETQTVSELWESISKLSAGRVTDNAKSDLYPLETRERQLDTLQTLVDTLKRSHLLMKK